MTVHSARSDLLHDLTLAVGTEPLTTDPIEIQGFLRDNSWLSPILAGYFRSDGAGADMPEVGVVVSPRTLDELRAAIAVAVRHEVPITPRGRGTSNFGQSIPLRGGMLLDLTRLNRILDVTDSSVT